MAVAARRVVESQTLHTMFSSPTWTADSRRLAFAIDADDVPGGVDRAAGVYTIGVDGSGLRLLVAGGRMPAYSPDGSKLAYVLDGDVVVANADGTNPRRITSTASVERHPAWSADGRLLAFDRFARRRSTIVVARSDGSGGRVVVSSPRYLAFMPTWRPRAPVAGTPTRACGWIASK